MTKVKDEYDVIVIGAGVNGLTAAAYLQKAGLEVAVFERRDEEGTHCATEEVGVPGIKYNLHACGLMPHGTPPYADLELEKFGLEMLTSSEWAYFHPILDGTAVMFHQYDANLQYEAWKRINKHDAEVFRKLSQFFGTNWADLMDGFFYSIPSEEAFQQMIEYYNSCPLIPKGWENMDGFELADILFEDERIKAAMLTFGVAIELMPWEKLLGPLGLLAMSFTMCLPWNYTARGGSHGLPHALFRCLLHHGGKVFQACPVDKIIVENGEAKGVVLSKHAVYPEAVMKARKAVISNVTPELTFLRMVGEDKLEPDVVTRLKEYDYDNAVFTVHYIFNEFPQWIQEKRFPEVHQVYGFDFGLENVQDVIRLGKDKVAGRIPDPPICAGYCVQGFSIADPTQAPPGLYPFHVWANVPADPEEIGGFEQWDEYRETYADKVEDLLVQYIPRLRETMVSRHVTTPMDTYRRNASAILGCWGGGALTYDQFYLNRPFPGCGAPRTPINKLYISQSLGAMPGATSLIQGTIAARVAGEDLGVRNQDWWTSKPVDPYTDYCMKKWGKWNPVVD
jgi:phytoene dehydrogenase-like protein